MRTEFKIFRPYRLEPGFAACYSAAVHRLQPPPAAFPANKKKNHVFFLMCFYHCFCFPASMFRHIEFEGGC
jgi:hypothetical protein